MGIFANWVYILPARRTYRLFHGEDDENLLGLGAPYFFDKHYMPPPEMMIQTIAKLVHKPHQLYSNPKKIAK